MSTTTTPYRQPWIGKKGIEICFILLPPFLSLAFIAACPNLFRDNGKIPDAGWVILILLIDVAHVYSTLYRTYFDRRAIHSYKQPLLLIPLIGLAVGIFVYWQSGLLFWRILAYLAVFHFIRQQYGFMRIYSRQESIPLWARRIDTFTIYYATIYPLIYWHLSEPRNFNWFVDNDFVLFKSARLLQLATILYWVMLLVYLTRELLQAIRFRYLNIPRVTILAGTILSWYFGIVFFNGDMAFTLLNVVSHGIPYMALIWLHGEKQAATGSGFLKRIFSRYGILLFLGIIFLLAYLEEGLWDMTVWKEHVSLFSIFHLAGSRLSDNWFIVVVPLLALPQITHYVIDGFIWRRPGANKNKRL
jgi:hypothetical protein